MLPAFFDSEVQIEQLFVVHTFLAALPTSNPNAGSGSSVEETTVTEEALGARAAATSIPANFHFRQTCSTERKSQDISSPGHLKLLTVKRVFPFLAMTLKFVSKPKQIR